MKLMHGSATNDAKHEIKKMAMTVCHVRVQAAVAAAAAFMTPAGDSLSSRLSVLSEQFLKINIRVATFSSYPVEP